MTEHSEDIIKVVDVFDDRELAVNAGSNKGLLVGTVLRIVSANPRVIKDPDSGEVLGEVIRAKAVVRIYEVEEKFALARTYRTRRVNIGGSGIGTTVLDKIFEPPKWETRVETLRVDKGAGQPLGVGESAVRIGDIAEVVPQGEADDVPSSTMWR